MGLSELAWTSYEATGATANAEAHICRWKLSSRTMVAAIFHPPGCLSAIYCGQPVSGQRSDPGERTASRSQALGGRGRRSGRFLVQPPCVFLFESVDEPTSGRPRGVGRPIHGRHYDHVALWRCGLARDLNELAACQVRLDHVKRHEAKSKSCGRNSCLAPRWERRHTFGDSNPNPPGRDRSEGSACTSWVCSARTAVGIGAPWAANGCRGETTMGVLIASSLSPVTCGGATRKDAITPTAQRPSSTGSITALDSTSN